MADRKVVFTRDGARRIAQTVRKSEGAQSGGPPARGRGYPSDFGRVVFGKTTGAVAKGASGSVTIWDGPTLATSVATTTVLTGVYNFFADVGATKWVAVVETVRGYAMIAAECT